MDLSTQIGAGAAFTAGANSGVLQRKLRVMSKNPNQPRIFSQQTIWLAIAGPSSIIMTFILQFPINDFKEGGNSDIYSIIIPVGLTLLYYFLVFYAFFRRWGVDDQKVWTRYGRLFYREIRFDQLTRLDTGIRRYKLYIGNKPLHRTLINIDYDRFDYTLVYINLLKELHQRRFDLPDTKTTDPNWEQQAIMWRRTLYQHATNGHETYYQTHPQENTYLQSLIPTPTHYNN